jgi:outer membrane protein assembly factor BamB
MDAGPRSSADFRFDEAVESHAVHPDGTRAVFATRDALVCVDRDGTEVWRFDFSPSSPQAGIAQADCTYSRDGTAVWLYRPDVYAGRGDDDCWFVLDASDGAVIGDAALPTFGGHGASQFVHPDGIHVLVDVGCGQDGSFVFLGRIDDGRLAWRPWPEADDPDFGTQCVVDVSADGRHVMAIEHDGCEVVFYDFATAEARLRIAVEEFGFDEGGLESVYLTQEKSRIIDERIAVVQLYGETGEADEPGELESTSPEWSEAGVGSLSDFVAYQAIDFIDGCIIGPSSVDGVHDGELPEYRPTA